MTNVEIIQLLQEYKTHLLKLSSMGKYNFKETREFLNRNRSIVQRILVRAGTLRLVSIAPPPAVGGYVMNGVNPLDIIFERPYGMDITSHLVNVIEQAIGVIEGEAGFYKRIEEKPKDADRDYDVWALIHPQVAEVSKKRMNDGYYADAVESACKAVNARVRDIVEDQTGEELDGASLMRRAFSPGNPIIRIANVESRSGHDTQQGFMDIFAGVMTGIRNPKAHEIENITREDALRKLIMLSILMYKLDRATELS